MDAGIVEFNDVLGVMNLEQRIEELVRLVEQLRLENHSLRARQSVLLAEKADLVERNESARSRVETIISRLRELEQV